MKTADGIKVIEFNARFGDPETEVVLPLLNSDIYEVFASIAENKPLKNPEWDDAATIGIVLASKGYPGAYQKGFPILGLETVDAKIYHMGTAVQNKSVVTSGGRVMIVVSKAPTLVEAHAKAMTEVPKIACENLFYRSDIGHKAF